MATVFERVRTIIVEQFDVTPEEVTLDTEFWVDLKADSIEVVELIMRFEDEFGAETPGFYMAEEDPENFMTVREVIEYLKEFGVEDS